MTYLGYYANNSERRETRENNKTMSAADNAVPTAAPYLLHANAVPLNADGKVLHLELGIGDVANSIITVGSESRAKILASLLDTCPNGHNSSSGDTPTTVRRSKRGFVTHTGTYNGTPVSIAMINMGYPNMDFLVREVRAVTDGPLRIVRLGSCASLRPDLPVGSVAVASEGSVFIRQNPDAWGLGSTAAGIEEGIGAGGGENNGGGGGGDGTTSVTREVPIEPYVCQGVAPADEGLSRGVLKELENALAGEGVEVVGCLNASADSFYSSQGRLDTNFEDRNEDLIQNLIARHPLVGSFEMETFQLFHLARVCRKSKIHASAASIVLANRIKGNAIALAKIAEIEHKAGEAVLRAITASD